MASMNLFICLKFLIFVQFLNVTKSSEDINQRTNIRCDEICSEKDLHLPENLKIDCQRGCRYFNIEFLSNAGNLNKVTDLNTTQDQCKSSCTDAYVDKLKRKACFQGCSKMYEIQVKAPYIHGWLVYMGASDRSMVLLQPDIDIPSDDDWILLDSAFRPRDYDNFVDPYKLTETHVQTMPIYPPSMRKHVTTQFCIPTWMWMIPIILVLGMIWIHYGNTIRNVFIYEDIEDDDDDDDDEDGQRIEKIKTEDFIVAVDSYFYPSPSIPPPPKYSEADEEAIIVTSDDGDANDNEIGNNLINMQRQNNHSNRINDSTVA